MHSQVGSFNSLTVKVLDFKIPKTFAVIMLRFEQRCPSIEKFVRKVWMDGQTVETLIRLLQRLSDLGLHCLPRHVCQKT